MPHAVQPNGTMQGWSASRDRLFRPRENTPSQRRSAGNSETLETDTSDAPPIVRSFRDRLYHLAAARHVGRPAHVTWDEPFPAPSRTEAERPRVDSANEIFDISYPPPDHYDDNPLVAPHFSEEPNLVSVEDTYREFSTDGGTGSQYETWYQVAQDVASELRHICFRHGIFSLGRVGLHIAGSDEEVADCNRDRMMLVVVEISSRALHRWRSIHGAVLALMTEYQLDGHAGVCVRYYRTGIDEERIDGRLRLSRGGETLATIRRQRRAGMVPPLSGLDAAQLGIIPPLNDLADAGGYRPQSPGPPAYEWRAYGSNYGSTADRVPTPLPRSDASQRSNEAQAGSPPLVSPLSERHAENAPLPTRLSPVSPRDLANTTMAAPTHPAARSINDYIDAFVLGGRDEGTRADRGGRAPQLTRSTQAHDLSRVLNARSPREPRDVPGHAGVGRMHDTANPVPEVSALRLGSEDTGSRERRRTSCQCPVCRRNGLHEMR